MSQRRLSEWLLAHETNARLLDRLALSLTEKITLFLILTSLNPRAKKLHRCYSIEIYQRGSSEKDIRSTKSAVPVLVSKANFGDWPNEISVKIFFVIHESVETCSLAFATGA